MNNAQDKIDPIPWMATIFMIAAFCVFVLCILGCTSAPKSRHLDIAGAYVTQTGTIAIGNIEVQSAPEGVESAMVRYDDDVAWFSDKKKHSISILLTGTNSVLTADSIVRDICNAFIQFRDEGSGGSMSLPASPK